MGTLGTFDSFTTARLGIYAAQHGLRVTGNNISNINTVGYTRQRIDQVSFKTGGHDRYASMFDRSVGNGALVKNINQIRDPYLDIRYRNTASDTAYFDTKLSGLEEIAGILDEVAKGGKDGDDETKGDGLLYAQLQELAKQLRAYGANPTYDNNVLVRGAAEALTMMIRDKATRLENLHNDKVNELTEDVDAVNGILTNIRNLNKSIRDAEIHGDKALELRDERNNQIDELSNYMHIKVEYSMEDVGAGIQVEKLTISLGNSNPDPKVETDSSVLVDGLYATQLSIPDTKPEIVDPNNPDMEHLKDFLYVVRDATDPDDLTKATGTNNAEEASTVENDNFSIRLGKLLDVRGREWENSDTVWTEIPAADAANTQANAVYKYQIGTSSKWALNDVIAIAGANYKVTADGAGANEIALDVITSPTKLAEFVAGKLTHADYDITSDGNRIVYTSKAKFPLGGAPANGPNLTLTNADDKVSLSDPPTVGYADPDATNPDGSDLLTAYTQIGNKWYKVETTVEHTYEVALDDNDLHGSLQAMREMLTEEGEFSSDHDILVDENAKTNRGIPYYQKSLDLLAQQIAKRYNELNQGFLVNQDGNYIDKDGKEILLAGADAAGGAVAAAPISKYNGLTAEQARNLIGNGFILKDERGNPILDKDGNQQADVNAWLEQAGGGVPHEYSGPLFSNGNDGDDVTGITAANIDVSHSWSTGAVWVVPKFEVLFDDGNGNNVQNSTQNININHMISMIDKPLLYNPQDIDPDAVSTDLFTGSFNDMVSNMMGVQAKDASTTNVSLTNSYTTLVTLDTSREGVSGVDLNDEAMNMMQYQKAYSAACRLMTAIDEALDRLINNTGIAGR